MQFKLVAPPPRDIGHKFEIGLPNDDPSQVWLNLIQWFMKIKCEKFKIHKEHQVMANSHMAFGQVGKTNRGCIAQWTFLLNFVPIGPRGLWKDWKQDNTLFDIFRPLVSVVYFWATKKHKLWRKPPNEYSFQIWFQGLSWPWSYGNCLSPLMLIWILIRARCTTLCHKVCPWLATGWWFSLGTSVSSTNKLTTLI